VIQTLTGTRGCSRKHPQADECWMLDSRLSHRRDADESAKQEAQRIAEQLAKPPRVKRSSTVRVSTIAAQIEIRDAQTTIRDRCCVGGLKVERLEL